MYISSCLCLFLCFSLCASLALFLSVFMSAFVLLSTQNYLSLCGCKFLFLTAYISCIFTYNHMFTWSFLWGQGSWNARTFFILWEFFLPGIPQLCSLGLLVKKDMDLLSLTLFLTYPLIFWSYLINIYFWNGPSKPNIFFREIVCFRKWYYNIK